MYKFCLNVHVTMRSNVITVRTAEESNNIFSYVSPCASNISDTMCDVLLEDECSDTDSSMSSVNSTYCENNNSNFL